ncbi:MAG: ABC transporter substrate-binding protein [Planctomycetes bacterium]|nr:ABC transporter substrate-binding protein [Planctomycetota bacterium]
MFLRRGMFLLALSTLAAGCSRPEQGSAAAGAPPRRICSVTLATDEILADLVEPERVVGVTYLVDDPGISNVAGRYSKAVARVDADIEMILLTEPDLVLVAPFSQAGFLGVIRRSGLGVHEHRQNDSFAEVLEGILALGSAVGEPERAANLVARVQARLALLDEKIAQVARRPRVLYWARGWTAGAGTNVHDMIERAGAINVAAEQGLTGHPQVSLELVLASDPEILLVPDWSGSDGELPSGLPAVCRNLSAVRAGRVVAVEGRLIGAASQHVADGVERLARLFHPELFEGDGSWR